MMVLLEKNSSLFLRLLLPDEAVPDHFHVTEVGKVNKTFIDCGGTRRESISCLVQAWVADDTHHRITAGKFFGILKLAADILGSEDLAVEVEYGSRVASQYKLVSVQVVPDALILILSGKQTACLAPDRCGVGSKCC